MGGGPCVVIIDGSAAQGEAQRLVTSIDASCLLVDYLGQDTEQVFNEADTKPVTNFHAKAIRVLRDLNTEISAINRALAEKYNR